MLRFNYYLYAPAIVLTGILLLPVVRRSFWDMGFRWLYILVIAYALSFCLTPVFGAIARRLAILDKPDERKAHLRATPLLGGAAVFAAILAAVALNGICPKPLCVMFIAAAILFGVGVIDDIREISATLKVVVQVAATSMVIYFGIQITVIPDYLGGLALAGNILLTAVWIIGITNAMNFFDGMDGLAGGLSALIAFFLGVVAFQTSQPYLGWISLAVLGACLGFLPYNFRERRRALIFLGDAGSTTLGFILACIAVYGNWAESNAVAILSPLMIFWVLIFDMVYISVARVLNGKVKSVRQWLAYVGQDHLHHRLAHVIGSRRKSVIFIYLLTICLGVNGLFCSMRVRLKRF